MVSVHRYAITRLGSAILALTWGIATVGNALLGFRYAIARLGNAIPVLRWRIAKVGNQPLLCRYGITTFGNAVLWAGYVLQTEVRS